MADDDERLQKFNEFGRTAMRWIFEGMVEDGTILIGDKYIAEIIDDFHGQLSLIVTDPDFDQLEFHPSFDYREKLCERAASEVESGDHLMAIVLYSTWFEHFINGALALAFRRAGRADSVVKPMLRELRLLTKASSLWDIAGLPAIEESDLQLLDKALAIRNGFVHYKWNPVSERESDQAAKRNADIAQQLGTMVARLLEIENLALWAGREREILDGFEEYMNFWEEQFGPIGAGAITMLEERRKSRDLDK